MKKIIIYTSGVFTTFAFLLFSGITYANPSFLQRAVQTNNTTATTTVQALSTQNLNGAIATSTLTYDTFLSGSSIVPADTFTALVQFQASSTASVLVVQPEYSQDGVDYYGYSATSTNNAPPTLLNDGHVMWQFASTTPTDYGTGVGARAMRAFSFPALTRYVRVKFYLNNGSQNGMIWAELVGKKQFSN